MSDHQRRSNAWNGRKLLITGCSSGIGRALANECSSRGWRVVASARPVDSLSDVTAVQRIALDVRDQKSVDAAAAMVGDVDVVVNNAGVGTWGPVETVDIDATRALFDTNFFGALR